MSGTAPCRRRGRQDSLPAGRCKSREWGGLEMADSRTARTLGGILILVLALVAVGTMVTLTVAGEPRVGILQGVVVDREGRAVPGALVTVPTLIEDDVRRVKTDEQGRWRAARVPIGYHEI